ncbi:MAG TPA: NAD(P)/FAD-dependent oxidoreductase [Candidatus Nitrosotenuis sp.]|nr:NAD(P)/FAD-dependent oxidoreductase [Candidatus Nitrosotenuis sp.]
MQSAQNNNTKILILGGGFAGISVLRQLQKKFRKTSDVKITLVNEDNFFLFTPMLQDIASGTLHPSSISIPLRVFAKNSEFIQASVSSIDLKSKLVAITRKFDGKVKILDFDYLVIALGGRTNFFGNKRIEKNSFTIKTIQDAIAIKSHLINMMEIADNEENRENQQKILSVVVVGAGFAGVEVISELNDFVKDSVKSYYPNVDASNIRMILVSANTGILPELGEELAKKAYQSLEKSGIRIIPNTKAVDAGEDFVFLGNGETIHCATLIWTAGVTIDPVIANIDCEHRGSRIVVDEFLRLQSYQNIFALGDCAAITDAKTGNLYPPTAQHALRESKIVSNNLYNTLAKKGTLKPFNFESKGMMAAIGKGNGIAKIFGYNISGGMAWLIWRTYYLAMLPTFEKKLKVAIDWTVDLFFKRDITLVRKIKRKSLNKFEIDGMSSLDLVLFEKNGQTQNQNST